jgi:glycosyltransferase involved in cell wall biosynthesis
LRILFASSRAQYPESIGGAPQTTHFLCDALSQAGHVVGVLSGTAGRTLCPPDITLSYKVFRSERPIDDVGTAIEAFRPDLAVVSTGDPLPLAARFRAFGIPAALYARDATFDRYGGDLKTAPLAGICAVSQALAGLISRKFYRPVTVIPAIIPHERYFVFETGDCVTFINPVPKKGVEIAFSLAENNPDIQFLFTECWPLGRARRVQLMKRAYRSGNIKWAQQMLDTRKIYAQTRLLLVPSQCFDGAPRVIREAQISGIPVLGSNIGGIPESIGDGGMTVTPDNLSEWQDKLRLFCGDKARLEDFKIKAMRHAARPAIDPRTILQAFEQSLGDWLDSARLVALK